MTPTKQTTRVERILRNLLAGFPPALTHDAVSMMEAIVQKHLDGKNVTDLNEEQNYKVFNEVNSWARMFLRGTTYQESFARTFLLALKNQ